MSIVAAAKSLGVSRNTVFNLVAKGELASIRISRRRLVPVDAIEDFIRERLGDDAA